MSAHLQLREFLLARFTPHELYTLIVDRHGARFVADAPSFNVEASRFVVASLELLERHQYINQDFFADLKCRRPNFAAEIADIAEVYEELKLGRAVHELSRKSLDAERGNAAGDVAHAVFLATSKIIEEVARCRHLEPGSAEQTQAQREIDSAVNFVHANFTPKSGERIAGAKLDRIIGSGTFGTVWEADDDLLRKKVAVKVFRLDGLTEFKKIASIPTEH
jgi:hypothetical protein